MIPHSSAFLFWPPLHVAHSLFLRKSPESCLRAHKNQGSSSKSNFGLLILRAQWKSKENPSPVILQKQIQGFTTLQTLGMAHCCRQIGVYCLYVYIKDTEETLWNERGVVWDWVSQRVVLGPHIASRPEVAQHTVTFPPLEPTFKTQGMSRKSWDLKMYKSKPHSPPF